MADVKKFNNQLKVQRNTGQEAIILGAVMVSLVASGETTNTAPTLADKALAISVAENQSIVLKVDATDSDKLTYAISGDDAALFSIDAATGTLSFLADPDFEAAADKGADNVYNIDVTVTDEGGLETTGTATITVTNVNEGLSFATGSVFAVNFAENQSVVSTINAIDIDGDAPIYTLEGGDSELFDISSVGVISFKTLPDFEMPQDVGGDNVYNFNVVASDADGLSTSHSFVGTVNDQPEPIVKVMNTYFESGKDYLINTETDQNQYFQDSTSLKDGGYVITWETGIDAIDGDGTALKMQIYNADGTKRGAEKLVNSFGDGDQYEPKVASLANGGFVITWTTNNAGQDDADKAIKMQIFNADGSLNGAEKLVNSVTVGDQDSANVIGLAQGGFVISWETPDAGGQGIAARIFDDDGAELVAEFAVNSSSDFKQYNPAIAALKNGNFVVTWHTTRDPQTIDGDDIMARIFDKNGVEVKADFQVSTHDVTHQRYPDIAALDNGNFVIVWRDNFSDQSGVGSSVKAQIYDQSGNNLGAGEILVNTQGKYDQRTAAVIAIAGGGFVVAWTTSDTDQDGSNSAVKAQIFNSFGDKAGEEFLANSVTNGNQNYPSMVGLEDGTFIIMWSSGDGGEDASGSGIRGQLFTTEPLNKFESGAVNKFSIELAADQAGAVLTDIVISGIPDGMVFNVGMAAGDGAISLTPEQLKGLEFTIPQNITGLFELTLTANSDNGGNTTIKVPMHIGQTLVGTFETDNLIDTNFAEYFDGLAAVGKPDKFSFVDITENLKISIVGDDLQVTIGDDTQNVNLLHSVEFIEYNRPGQVSVSFDASYLFNYGYIDDISELEFDYWLVNHYEYSI